MRLVASPLFINHGVDMENKITLLKGEHIDIVNDNISLIQKDNGLKLGTDALLLASYIRRSPKARAIELGGGSGIISLLCAARGKLGEILCVEVQKSFADIIERNIQLNGLEDKIKGICCDIRDTHLFGEGEYDVVFSNPPYMISNGGRMNDHDEMSIARHEIFGKIDDFCLCASKKLKHGGLFYCVYRPDRAMDLLHNLRQNKLEPKKITFVHANTESGPSVMLVEAKKGGKSGCIVTAPLIIYKDASNTEYTEQIKRIYEKGSFEN
jgi:tRNA1(Val) A37 N6-methylase TrmN6